MKAHDPIYQQLARIGQALASGPRLALLDLLSQGPRTVEALAQEVGLTLANASQHLKVLRQARLVEAEKRGIFVTYRLADQAVDDFYGASAALAEARLAEVQQIARAFVEKRVRLEPVDRRLPAASASGLEKSRSSTFGPRRSTEQVTSRARSPFRSRSSRSGSGACRSAARSSPTAGVPTACSLLKR